MSVLRSIFAVIAGFFAASAIMTFVEYLNGQVLYPELGKAAEGLKDPEQLRALLASAPATALVVVLVGWLLGSFIGGWFAARMAGRSPIRHGIVLGVLLMLAGIANNLMIPPPAWFWAATLVVFLPAAYFGARRVPER